MAAQAALTTEQIERLTELVARIAQARGTDAGGAIDWLVAMTATPAEPPARRTPADFAAGLLAVRTRRNGVLGQEVFRDPAWDMLLELYVAADQGRPVCVSTLCYISGVPATTALRHVDRMRELGLVERAVDPMDRRRHWVHANPDTLKCVETILLRIQDAALA